MDVIRCLSRYREMQATLRYLDNEMRGLRQLLKDERFILEQLASDALPATDHSATGRTGAADGGRPERLAVRSAMGDPSGLRELLRRKKLQRESAAYALARIDALLSALTERERFVITKFYIEKFGWSEIADMYRAKTWESREIPALKKLRDKTIKKLERLVLECA